MYGRGGRGGGRDSGRGGGGGGMGMGMGMGGRGGGRGGANNPFAAQQQQQQQPQYQQQYQPRPQQQPPRAANPFAGPSTNTQTGFAGGGGRGGNSGRNVFAPNANANTNTGTGPAGGFQKSNTTGGMGIGMGVGMGKGVAVAAKNPFAQGQSNNPSGAMQGMQGSLFAPKTAGPFAQPPQQQQQQPLQQQQGMSSLFQPPPPSQPAPNMMQRGFAAANPFQTSSAPAPPAAPSLFAPASSAPSSSSVSSNPFSKTPFGQQTPQTPFNGFMKSNTGFASAGAAPFAAPRNEQAVKENLKTIDFKAVLGVHKEEENVDSAVNEEDLVGQEPVNESKADDSLNLQAWMESFPLKHLSEEAPQGSVFDFLEGGAFVAGKIPTCVPR